MMAHYDDEALVALVDAAPEGDPHLLECAECRESLDQYRAVTSCLGREAVWDLRVLREEPVPQTIANLRAFADRMRGEDQAAVPLVADLLSGPREAWMPRLLADARYRTAGVVRKLMEASDKAIDVMPPDALEISALATEIADNLDPAAYPSDTVMKLRGNAWRDRGFCLYYVGRFVDADHALLRSQKTLIGCEVADYDLARAGIALSLAQRAFDKFDTASESARSSAAIFTAFGDLDRFVSAVIVEAQAAWKSGRTEAALKSVLEALGKYDVQDRYVQACLAANVAFYYRELGDAESALKYYEYATFVRSSAGLDDPTGLIIRWNVAGLLGRAGQIDEAERRMLPLIVEFESLGMLSEAVQGGLELSEFYLERGRFDAVESFCKKAVDFYSKSGMPTTARALTALGFLREATRERQVTPRAVQHVRRYLDRLTEEPALLFLPPPV